MTALISFSHTQSSSAFNRYASGKQSRLLPIQSPASNPGEQACHVGSKNDSKSVAHGDGSRYRTPSHDIANIKIDIPEVIARKRTKGVRGDTNA
jgi:hypothetical protein